MTGLTLAVLLAVAAVVVPVAGVVSSVETALAQLSVARVESLVKDERSGAARLQRVIDNRPDHINLLVLIRTVLEAGAAVLVTIVAEDLIEPTGWAVAVAVVVASLLIYVIVGVISRTAGRRNPYSLSLKAAPVLLVSAKILSPISRLLIRVGGLFAGGGALKAGPFASEIELREAVDIASERGVVEVDEQKMIQSVFDLGTTTVRTVMVPRPEMVWIEQHKTADQATRLCIRSGLSRVPVVGESVDDVVGVVYLKDLVTATFDAPAEQRSVPVSDLMREPFFVPDSRMLADLLEDMQRDQIHIAVLIDEYGGTSGLVSIEDILEEIVGEISDEYDHGDVGDVEALGPGEFRVVSWLSLDDLRELYEDTGVEFDEEEYEDVETVAGLVAFELDRVPLPGAEVDVAGLHLVCEGGRDRRGRIKVRTIVVTGPVRPEQSEDNRVNSAPDTDNGATDEQ
ncbi:MAG: hemolysin family protein [Corynebacterium variabile]|uniref:hemolysin family protein n=1 Tax=Corynebacterium variabile TaxID=1727 RepID=UPI0026473420|nr:hemolysin family protein [Corynebacterium variabile]MDN6477290.1 hemolysin family protein [Corynebacterium variabile]MDN6844614.1 hemolysin family protein [Corynebacterium variabile]